MIVYCFNQQEEALSALSGGSKSEGVPANISTQIRERCERQWHTDYEMIKYCIGQQTSAWWSLR
jgi:hypothetical protein